jgi:hypothetical protein
MGACMDLGNGSHDTQRFSRHRQSLSLQGSFLSYVNFCFFANFPSLYKEK